MTPRPFPIERRGPGTLSTMGRPAGDERLRADLGALVALGVEGVVSMLMPDEASRLGLSREPEVAADLGLEFRPVPIPDFQLPDGGLDEASGWIRALLSNGAHVVIHCHAGIGRSSMLAAAVLVDEGFEPEAAWVAIEGARGRPVPDTDAQRRWLFDRCHPGPA